MGPGPMGKGPWVRTAAGPGPNGQGPMGPMGQGPWAREGAAGGTHAKTAGSAGKCRQDFATQSSGFVCTGRDLWKKKLFWSDS